jgi:hypothetical protein
LEAPVIINKEMGLTHADFFRTIQSAIGDKDLELNRRGVVLRKKDKKLEIFLGPERERKIGLLVFPVTDVSFKFYGYESSRVKSVIKRFDLRFKRGGG